jgi:hypothetical protein
MSLSSLIKGFEKQVEGKNYIKYVNQALLPKVVSHIAEIGSDIVDEVVDELTAKNDYSKLLTDPTHDLNGVLRLIVRDAIAAYKAVHAEH